MNYRPIQPDRVKYEMRMVQGQDPFEKHKRRPGGFGRFLSAIGRVLGAVAMPFSIFCPPAMIGALGMYGLGKIGDQIQVSAQMKTMQQQAAHAQSRAVFPGAEEIFGGPRSVPISAVQADILNVLYARNDLMMESSHAMES